MTRKKGKKRKYKSTPQKKRMTILFLSMVALLVFAFASPAIGEAFSSFETVGDEWTGQVYLKAMKAEGLLYDFPDGDERVIDIDGIPVWGDYYMMEQLPVRYPLLSEYPNLVDYPLTDAISGDHGFAPETSWNIVGLRHVDVELDGTLAGDIPSVITNTGNLYTEVYYYTFDLRFRLHSSEFMTLDNTFVLSFADWADMDIMSHHLGTYRPIKDLYIHLEVDVNPLNGSIVDTGIDMGTYGDDLELKFFRQVDDQQWINAMTQQELVNEIEAIGATHPITPVQINRDPYLPDFDKNQGLNILENNDDDEITSFSVGFNQVGNPALYWNYQGLGFDILTHYEDLKLYDMEVIIPLEISITNIYDIYFDGSDIIPDGDPIPDDDDDPDPDDGYLDILYNNIFYDFLYEEFGPPAIIFLVAILGVAAAIIFKK